MLTSYCCLAVVTAGAAGVFTDLKAAASAVVRTAGKESSRTVGHKYGPDAEKVADNAIVATGNTVGLVAVSGLALRVGLV